MGCAHGSDGAALDGFAALAASLKPLRRHLDIAHHVRGRIRLRLSPAGLGLLAPGLARRLADHAAATPAIRGVRVNPAALSVVIDYAPGLIAPDLWGRLIGADDAEFDQLAGIGRPAAGAASGARNVAG
jgi:hypothetical protein